MPEQRIPDITVRSNDNLTDPDVKVSHNEWYAGSWEIDFGKQIDEQTLSEITNNFEQTTTQEVTHTNDADTTQEVAEKQTVRTDNAEPSSPDFSSLTTDVRDNLYIRRPPPIGSPYIPHDRRLQLLEITQAELRSTIYDLIINLKLIQTSDCLTL